MQLSKAVTLLLLTNHRTESITCTANSTKTFPSTESADVRVAFALVFNGSHLQLASPPPGPLFIVSAEMLVSTRLFSFRRSSNVAFAVQYQHQRRSHRPIPPLHRLPLEPGPSPWASSPAFSLTVGGIHLAL